MNLTTEFLGFELKNPLIASASPLSATLDGVKKLEDNNNLPCSLCANTGIHSGEDILKAVMSGADATALSSVLLQKGESEINNILNDIKEWMEKHEYESITQMKGSISLSHTNNPSAYERNSYMYALQHYRR